MDALKAALKLQRNKSQALTPQTKMGSKNIQKPERTQSAKELAFNNGFTGMRGPPSVKSDGVVADPDLGEGDSFDDSVENQSPVVNPRATGTGLNSARAQVTMFAHSENQTSHSNASSADQNSSKQIDMQIEEAAKILQNIPNVSGSNVQFLKKALRDLFQSEPAQQISVSAVEEILKTEADLQPVFLRVHSNKIKEATEILNQINTGHRSAVEYVRRQRTVVGWQ